jgi:uncharacterized protein (UPF0261 family)
LAQQETSVQQSTVVLVGTLDTKSVEYAFLRDRLREHDVGVLLVDAGVLGEPLIEADITRRQVAEAAGADLDALADTRDRSAALDAMGHGAAGHAPLAAAVEELASTRQRARTSAAAPVRLSPRSLSF